jgi:hypothetical protein
MKNIGPIIFILNLLVLAIISLRLFWFTAKMGRYMRAQTALISLLTRHQGQKPNVNVDLDVFRILSENGLIEELPLQREPDTSEPDGAL